MLRTSSRTVVLAGLDLGAWTAAFLGTGWLQEFAEGVRPFPLVNSLLLGLLCGALFVVVGLSVHLHQGRAAAGSFEDVVLVGTVAAVVGVTELVVNLAAGQFVTRTALVLSPVVALTLMLWARMAYRVLRDRRRTGFETRSQTRAVIVGAGDTAQRLVRFLQGEADAPWVPVAMLEDDGRKRHRRFHGVAVHGGTQDLAAVAERFEATTAIIAISSADSDLIRDLHDQAQRAGLELKVVPTAADMLTPHQVSLSDVRDLELTDLLGRHQIDTDIESIAGYLTGKRVLVTGAGGSIGSELCRQIARFGPAELIMLDRDESALHAVQLSIYGRAMLDGDDVVLADIRDSLYIDTLFEARCPQVVFHAAALKHLPMLEQYPGEAIKTNVWGTLSILEAAKAHHVERFVNISTDKAANPCSVLGYSKRLAEGLTAAIAEEAEGTYLSVRFGNVLGSRGSVLDAFTAQIAAGGPVTVTHPEVTRYFMTVQEAVQLMIQAAAIGRDGEALVLDMGEPVSIDAVARQLIELSGKRVEIVYTGLREGEKMHEVRLGEGEQDQRPVHPRVSHTQVPAFDPLEAREMDPWDHGELAAKSLKACATQLGASSPLAGGA
ncbi:FlaA1/EpsC-like NDP-sugar epimerase [Marmoricola sp. URHA0025 HA25]